MMASLACNLTPWGLDDTRTRELEARAAAAEAHAAAAEARAKKAEEQLRLFQEIENHECGRALTELKLLRAQLAKDGGAPIAPRPRSSPCAPGDPLCGD